MEEELTKNKTKHLCLYGKFCKDVDIINFEEIKHLGLTEEIVFVFDAINEIDESNQLKLLNKLQDMKKVRGVRIIVSYRNYTVNTDILEKYQKLSEFQYEFPGVSFESVLEWLQKEAIVDINEYVDVIYSNNPLLLSQLPYILPDKKEKNNISRQTYIYEQYIKRVLDRDTWLKTKVLAKFLYDNNKKHFTIEELTSLEQFSLEKILLKNFVKLNP